MSANSPGETFNHKFTHFQSKEAKITSLGEVKKILLFPCTKHRTTCNTHTGIECIWDSTISRKGLD